MSTDKICAPILDEVREAVHKFVGIVRNGTGSIIYQSNNTPIGVPMCKSSE